jgi:hypothetical protein
VGATPVSAATAVVQDDFIDPSITTSDWPWTNVLFTEEPSYCVGRTPDLANAPGGVWQWTTYNFYSQGIDAYSGSPLLEAVRMTGGGSAGIPLASNGSYNEPVRQQISASVSFLSSSPSGGIRLGYWNDIQGNGTFTGLELDSSGGLTLVENNVF